jgi:hypothetical protein
MRKCLVIEDYRYYTRTSHDLESESVRSNWSQRERDEADLVSGVPRGLEAQVDYGSGPLLRDPHFGKCRRTRLFVLTPCGPICTRWPSPFG